MNLQTTNILKHLIQLLNERNFITRQNLLRSNNTEFISYKYGPAGASLRNNLIAKWREDVQFSGKNEVCFFVENSTLLNSTSLSLEQGLWSSEYISNILRMCAGTILGRTSIPFTIAQIGVGMTSHQVKKDEKAFLFDSNEETNLTLLRFCRPESTHGTFQAVLQQRLCWWQQFANNSTNFQQIQTNENLPKTRNNSFLSSSGVQFHFPWGWNPIEKTIVLSNRTYSLNKESPNPTSGFVDDILTASVVISNVTLEKGMFALLCDSYKEKMIKIKTLSKNKRIDKKTNPHTPNSTTKCRAVLKLHHSLSPYKVGIVMYGTKVRQLRLLAERVIKDLKTLNLQVLGSAPAETSSSLESQCLAYEQIGVLYMALINDKSLETGLIRIIDNKEESEMDPVHISNIKEYIIKNLKLTVAS